MPQQPDAGRQDVRISRRILIYTARGQGRPFRQDFLSPFEAMRYDSISDVRGKLPRHFFGWLQHIFAEVQYAYL